MTKNERKEGQSVERRQLKAWDSERVSAEKDCSYGRPSERALKTMPGDACVVCEICHAKEPQLSYLRFPSSVDKQALWLQMFQVTEEQLRPYLLNPEAIKVGIMTTVRFVV